MVDDATDGGAGDEVRKRVVERALFAPIPQWRSPVFFSGLIIGLALIAGAYAGERLGIGTPAMTALTMAGGLGIMLGAFGSTAFLQYQGLAVTGVGVLSVALFLLLTDGTARHLKIAVKNVPKGAQASLYLDAEVHGSRRGNQYEFIVLDGAIAAQSMDLSLSWTEDEKPTEALFHCIPVTNIRSLLGSGRTTEWSFQRADMTLAVGGATYQNGCKTLETAAATWSLDIVTPANAQEPVPEVSMLLEDLESDDLTLRRSARTALALQGTDAIQPMMAYWAAAPHSYRRSLGVAVALAAFLRDNKAEADAVSTLFSRDDYKLLVEAAGHPDRTLRVYATEFLFDLGAPASAESILEALPFASDDGQYNSIFVLTNIVPKLPSRDKVDLSTALQAPGLVEGFGPATAQEYRELLVTLSGP